MSKTALVVDDSKTMREMVTYTLIQVGFSVLEAENGQEALTRLGGQSISLIITDLNMPVMDGITFITAARKVPASRFTPILMLTTEAGQEMKEKGKAAGATGWLVKPFNPEMLVKVINKVVA